MEKKSFVVRYELDESGWWVATVQGVTGVHTQGRTIESARERIREALRAAGERLSVDIKDDVVLPKRVKDAVGEARAAREAAEKSGARAQRAFRAAVKALTERLGLSVRDAAELLGVSHQRVQQVASGQRRSA